MSKSVYEPGTCPKCHGSTRYYHGLLGYEAHVCNSCERHYRVGIQELARKFIEQFGNTAATLITALDAHEIESEQDWNTGTTTWWFADDTGIKIEGSEVSIDYR